jgi:hypothetical protein
MSEPTTEGEATVNTCTDPDGTFHTHDTTVWFRLAYGTWLPLWRVVPHRWVTRPCPAWPSR